MGFKQVVVELLDMFGIGFGYDWKGFNMLSGGAKHMFGRKLEHVLEVWRMFGEFEVISVNV